MWWCYWLHQQKVLICWVVASLLCCLYCVHWCPVLCFLESPFGHWVFEPVFKTLLEMCPQAHNPSFLAWSQSPNCSTSQADSSRPEVSSASGVIPRRSLLNMIWTCTLYPSGFLFFRGPESVKNRMMKGAGFMILDPPSPILLGRSWVDLGLHSVHPHPFPSPGLQPSASHYPSRHDQRSPTSLEVSLVAEPFRQLRLSKKMNQLGLISPIPREDQKWQVFYGRR